MTLGAQGASGLDEHPLGLADVGIMAAGAIAVGHGGVKVLLCLAGVVVAGEAEGGAGLLQHALFLSGVGIVAGEAAVVEDGVAMLLGRLLLVAHVAEGVSGLIEEVFVVALVGAVAGGAPLLEDGMGMPLARRLAVVAEIAELASPGRRLESPLSAGMGLARLLVADDALSAGHGAVDEFRLPHHGVTLGRDAALLPENRGNHRTEKR